MEPDIDEIIVKHLQNQASEAELKHLDLWLEQSPDNRELLKTLQLLWKEPSREPVLINSDEVKEKIWQRVQGLNHNQPRRFASKRYYWRLAAAVALIISASIVLYGLFKNEIASETPIEEVIITKSNPAGQKSRFNLPDGSIVWLNAASSIEYPENFTASARNVSLSGEAYFEVVKDTLRPFKVITRDLSLVVLGTSFNVHAFEEDDITNVALIEGKLRVTPLEAIKSGFTILEKGEGITFSHATTALQKVRLNGEALYGYISWKDGVLEFYEDNFTLFVKKIERWYGVEVEVSGKVPQNWNIKGSFKNEYLDNILESIAFNKDFKYELKGKQLKFIFN